MKFLVKIMLASLLFISLFLGLSSSFVHSKSDWKKRIGIAEKEMLSLQLSRKKQEFFRIIYPEEHLKEGKEVLVKVECTINKDGRVEAIDRMMTYQFSRFNDRSGAKLGQFVYKAVSKRELNKHSLYQFEENTKKALMDRTTSIQAEEGKKTFYFFFDENQIYASTVIAADYRRAMEVVKKTLETSNLGLEEYDT